MAWCKKLFPDSLVVDVLSSAQFALTRSRECVSRILPNADSDYTQVQHRLLLHISKSNIRDIIRVDGCTVFTFVKDMMFGKTQCLTE
ncbi:hypothetical protein BV898_18857 [Hypsibius exemplaris]|uniref:Uncharacterized protein n=1 Tax=Hypsibius exemplaris TaxID=2072580 RepID=A0A9X6RNW8_HYPEX|nr:hypothetical protein BV898_18857 [Hypsibius exemplaris]